MDARQTYFTHKLKRSFDGETLRKAVDRVIENQDRYYALLRSTGEQGIEELITAIHKSSFFIGHSHSHHHYATGLVEHSLGVYDQMVSMANKEGYPLNPNDIILVGLLHDVCMGRNDDWRNLPGKHGGKSANIAKKYLPNISNAVYEAIRCHRHNPSEESKNRNPLWYLVRKSDMADAATSPGFTLKFMKMDERQ